MKGSLVRRIEAHLRDGSGTGSPPTLPPRSLVRARMEMEQRFRDGEPQAPPPTMNLDRMVASLRVKWRRQRSLELLEPLEGRWLPWLVFYQASEQSEPLAQEEGLLDAMRLKQEQMPLAGPVLRLLAGFLYHHPFRHRAFPLWQKGVRAMVLEARSPRLNKWKELIEDNRLELLKVGWHKRAGIQRWEGGEPGTSFVDQELFSGINGAGNASVVVAGHALRQAAEERPAGGMSIEWMTRFSRKVLEIALLPEGRLRGASLHKHLAAAFLARFRGAPVPPDGIRRLVQEVVLRICGDPRMQIAQWDDIEQNAAGIRDLMLRWLVVDSWSLFLEILTATADPQFEERKRFWEYYFTAGHVQAAWVVLGNEGASKARAMGLSAGGWGKVVGGTANQSVLILKMEGVTIAEWTHAGSCGLWQDGEAGSPRPYAREYRATGLRHDMGSEDRVVHRGAWQFKVSQRIHHYTRIRHPNPAG